MFLLMSDIHGFHNQLREAVRRYNETVGALPGWSSDEIAAAIAGGWSNTLGCDVSDWAAWLADDLESAWHVQWIDGDLWDTREDDLAAVDAVLDSILTGYFPSAIATLDR